MTEKLLKTRFAFIVTVKINEHKLNFPPGVKVQSVNLSLKVHSVVSGEGKMLTKLYNLDASGGKHKPGKRKSIFIL